MSGGPFRFPRSAAAVRLVRLAVPLAAACLAGCALSRPPTADARIEGAARRLAEAPSDSARRAVTLDLLASAGLTPLAGERFAFGSPEVLAGFVPGRVPAERDTLVVVAAGRSGASVAAVVEAVRMLVEAAAQNEGPERSVLVALWEPGRTAAQGLADVRAFPLWPSDAVRGVLVVNAAGPGVEVPAGPSATVEPDGASAAALATRIQELAARPVRSDTSAVRADSADVPLN